MRRFVAVLVPSIWLFCCGGDDAVAPQTSSGGTKNPSTDAGPSADAKTDPSAEAGSDPAKSPYDWVGVIGTGQSLSVGATAEVLVSTTPSFNNGKLKDNGVDPLFPLDAGTDRFEIAPLVEAPRNKLTGYTDGQYPNNISGETPHSGMASELTHLFTGRGGADYVTLHSVVGWSGHPLVDIDKEGAGRGYPGSLMEARAFAALAQKAGKTFGYGAVVLTHGESDAGNPDYGKGLKTFIDDYNVDLKAITKQTSDVVLMVSQQSVNSGPGSSAVQVWQAGKDNPRILCTGPKYQYGYSGDNLHFPAAGYQRLGEKYGEIFDIVVNQKKTWKPVQPKSITQTGKTIVLVFDVPNLPLQWDETLEPPHQTTNTAWKKGRGFEVSSGDVALNITAADITAPDTVTLTLAAAPPKGALVVGYATTQDGASNQGGLVTGYRGQLRDSDEIIGFDEESVAVKLTKNSALVTAADGAMLARRAVRDVVTGDGLPAGWTVLALQTATTLKMSDAWPGESADVTVKIHHDLHNYAVHFSQSVP